MHRTRGTSFTLWLRLKNAHALILNTQLHSRNG